MTIKFFEIRSYTNYKHLHLTSVTMFIAKSVDLVNNCNVKKKKNE